MSKPKPTDEVGRELDHWSQGNRKVKDLVANGTSKDKSKKR